MAVEVNYWPPRGTNVGHASLLVEGDNPTEARYLSVWPGEALAILYGLGALNNYQDDVDSENAYPVVVRLYGLNEDKIRAQIDVIRKNPRYSFIALNCATNASICLNAGVPGIEIITLGNMVSSLVNPALGFLTSPVSYTPATLYINAKVLATRYG
jgi:hypothetical protein